MRKYIAFIIFIIFINFCDICFGQAYRPRYISLAPSTTEILFALGLDDEIVGVSTYCNFPDQALTKERVGEFSNPNIEKIISLKPDYIFCTGLEQAPVVNELKRLKLKVYVGDPSNMKELMASIRDISEITGRIQEGRDLIRQMLEELDQIYSKVKLVSEKNRPKVFIEIWYDPLMTAGRGSFVDELVTLAGGLNIASDVKRPYSIFSQEEVIRRDPEYIFLAYMDEVKPVTLMKKRFGWANVTAVKVGNVYNDINPDIILRPGPRVIEGIRQLNNRLFHKDE